MLDLDAVDETRLTGEAALLASLRRGRTGRMGDIVATIQADQDRIIRDDPGGILVVEGGPGTGKTVVALHRAAYLLYTHRKRLARRGILVIGPSATFLRYIDQVLPSLGENDVVLATIGSLFPGVDARGPDTPEAARVKGDAKMAGVLAKAVTALRQVPAAAIEIKVDGTVYRLTPRMCRQARAEAEQRLDPDTGDPLPHNTARARVHRRRWCGAGPAAGARPRRPAGLPPGDEEDLRAELAAEPAVRSVLDVLWPEFTPAAAAHPALPEPGRARPCRRRARRHRPATRQGRGRPPTCRCSTSSPSCSAPVDGHRAGGQAQARRGRGRARRGARVRGAARGAARRGRGHRRAVP